MNIRTQIEALIFSSEQPLLLEDIVGFFSNQNGVEYSKEDVLIQINESMQFYQEQNVPFEIVHSGGGYIFKTKKDYHEIISNFLQRDVVKRLTAAALETLAVVAYKQPVTKSNLELVRGVNCEYTLQKLMEKELVEIQGRSEDVGRPLLYGTTSYFLDYFGINSLEELPKLKEFTESENQIGETEKIIQED